MCLKIFFGLLVFAMGLVFAGLAVLGIFANTNLYLIIGAGVFTVFQLANLISLVTPCVAGVVIILFLHFIQVIILSGLLGFFIYDLIKDPEWWHDFLDEMLVEFLELEKEGKTLNYENVTYFFGGIDLILVIVTVITLILAIIMFSQSKRRFRQTVPIVHAQYNADPYTTLDVEGPDSVRLYNIKL